MNAAMVQLSALNPRLPAPLRAELETKRQAIVSGRRLPFATLLVDNSGRSRLAHGAQDERQITSKDWFVQGVVGSVLAAR